MYRLLPILLWWLVLSCNKQVALPPDIEVSATDTSLHNNNGVWMRNGQLFNGYIVEQGKSRILSKIPIVKGMENGKALGWYEDGKPRYERNFVNNNREGVHKGWYENGQTSFEYFFKDDKYEGVQKTYFADGKPWQVLNYVHGYEEGKQKTWNNKGNVLNNFTVKNGKLYGVIGRYDCLSVYSK